MNWSCLQSQNDSNLSKESAAKTNVEMWTNVLNVDRKGILLVIVGTPLGRVNVVAIWPFRQVL